MKYILPSFFLVFSFYAQSQEGKYPKNETNTIVITLQNIDEIEAIKGFAKYLLLKGYFVEEFDEELSKFSTKRFQRNLGKGLNTRGIYNAYIYVFSVRNQDLTKIYVSASLAETLTTFGASSYVSKRMKNENPSKSLDGALFKEVHELVLEFVNGTGIVEYSEKVTYLTL